MVSWKDARDYIGKLNSRSGKQYRLPTEAEWEYAARSVAWYGAKSNSTHPVGRKQPNAEKERHGFE